MNDRERNVESGQSAPRCERQLVTVQSPNTLPVDLDQGRLMAGIDQSGDDRRTGREGDVALGGPASGEDGDPTHGLGLGTEQIVIVTVELFWT